jgi:hypothetical protein
MPLVGAVFIEMAGTSVLFAASAGAALLQWLVTRRLGQGDIGRGRT